MSRLLGNPAHTCYVYPDFDKALAKFAAAGIGPFFVLDEVGGMGDYRGEQHPFTSQVAFVYSGEACFEIITPNKEGISAYNEYLGRNPGGGLHHIAYYSADFAKTLAMMAAAGKPPEEIRLTMEKQMTAERTRRAVVTTAEGEKSSAILRAEGQKQSQIVNAEGAKQAAILRAEGEAKAIDTVFTAIHEGNPDEGLLAYQYLLTLPKIADGQSNKVWIIPSEFNAALGGLAEAFARGAKGASRPVPPAGP